MSQESAHWLNNYTLIGHTEKRRNVVDAVDPSESRFSNEGRAWHYNAALQGAESNHYPGAIPVEDVKRRLFGWKVVEGDVQSTGTVINEDGVESFTIVDPTRKTMMRPPRALSPSDMGAILGVFKSGYGGHDYEKWLIDNVADILDDGLGVGSAGLLRGGAVAWVAIEMEDNYATAEGVTFRPRLLAVTSFDGSISTTYKKVATMVVCDNTLAAGLGETGQQIKVRHTANSHLRLQDAREALGIVHTIADDFAAEVADLCAVKVSDGDWAKFLEEIAPTKDKDGEDLKGRGLTMATKKHDELEALWNSDDRVAPWRGTAFGALQAVNTWAHHVRSVQGGEAARAARNARMMVEGGFDALDTGSVRALEAVGVGRGA